MMKQTEFNKKVKEIIIQRSLDKEHLAILAMQLREEVNNLEGLVYRYNNVSKSASDALIHSCEEAVAKIMAIVNRMEE
jgi:hypothetical protein